jgi:3-hydroxyanthranilate 3,4-dioxygenase
MERKEMELHLAMICILIQPKRLIRLCVSGFYWTVIERKRAGQGFTDGLLWFVISCKPQNYMKSILNSNIERIFYRILNISTIHFKNV